MKLKVFLMGNLDGTHAGLVACKNRRTAAELLGTTLGQVKREGVVLGDDTLTGGALIGLATSRPGVVFKRVIHKREDWFVPGEPKPPSLATPRPWRAYAGGVFRGGDASSGECVGNFVYHSKTDGQAEEDAKLTALAVNLFQEFVAVCQEALEDLTKRSAEDTPTAARLRDVLRKATEN